MPTVSLPVLSHGPGSPLRVTTHPPAWSGGRQVVGSAWVVGRYFSLLFKREKRREKKVGGVGTVPSTVPLTTVLLRLSRPLADLTGAGKTASYSTVRF